MGFRKAGYRLTPEERELRAIRSRLTKMEHRALSMPGPEGLSLYLEYRKLWDEYIRMSPANRDKS